MTTRQRLREFVIRTSPWPPFRWAYAAVYGAALVWLVIRLRRIPEIRSLDLRLPRSGHCFGSSDLDLRAETEPLAPSRFFALAERLADVLLPGGTWLRIFDLYAFPATEYALQARVAPRSARSERRWIRLFGKRRPADEPHEKTVPGTVSAGDADDARLGRAMFEYTWLCQYVFESDLDLHRARILYTRIMRIDEELRARSAGREHVPPDLAREVLDAASGPALGGRVRRASFEALARAHALALAETTALARIVLERPRPPSPDTVEPMSCGSLPDTLGAAIGACREPVAAFCASRRGMIRSAVLGAAPGSRYDHRIYLLARDDLGIAEHVELCRSARELFVAANPTVPYAFFRTRYPIVLTPRLWRAAGCWYHALRSVEEHYFLVRHPVVIWGEDPRAELVAPDRSAVLGSAAVAVADLRNRIWGALHHRQSAHLADLLGGRIPALWLVLARSRVATSAAEAVAGCVEQGFPHARILAELDDRLAGRHPRELPRVEERIWRPAIEALDDWLDDLAARALSAVI
ncbi:MAG: hypothetical protein ACREQQ_17660 [Candidatus Binatia bacterium]